MNENLDTMARWAEDRPFFMASILTAYARSEQIDEATLAARLELPVEKLTALRLCRAPDTDAEGFRRDVQSIAEYFGMNPTTLAEIVRRGQSITQLREQQAPSSKIGFLMAARDQESDPAQEPEPDEKSS